MLKETEVVVIGAGVIGTSVAYHLSSEGVGTALVDMGDVADVTSSACDGNILAIDKQPGYDSRLGLKSQELLAEMVKDLPLDVEYTQKGSTLAVENEAQMESAKDFVRRQQEIGLPIELMTESEIHEDAPSLAGDIIGGVVCHSDAALNPMAFTYAMAEGARANGTEILPYTEVTDILRDENGAVRAVKTSRGEITCDVVVCAAGVFSPQVTSMVEIEVPIRPRKGHILVAERGPQVYWRKMQEYGYLMAKFSSDEVDRDPEMTEYGIAFVFEPTESGNFLIGSSREFVGFDDRCNPRVLELLAKRAIRFFPRIAGVNVIRSYAGLRPYTPDHYPVVSPVSEVEGFYVAAGHEGDGIGLAPITGRLIADMITDASPVIDPEPLRLSRFED